MDEYISKQAAIDALAKFVPYAICDESTESYTNGLTDAYNMICQLPSAQPEIIRCKNCIHNNDCDIQYSAQAGDNFFCGFGETEKDVREDVYE